MIKLDYGDLNPHHVRLQHPNSRLDQSQGHNPELAIGDRFTTLLRMESSDFEIDEETECWDTFDDHPTIPY
jgi:hypothetical protein